MADINSARQLIYNWFIDRWENETPFSFDNEEFDPPGDSPWVRLSVRNRVSNQSSLGRKENRKFIRDGAIIVQVFAPIEKGTDELDRLSELVREIFEGERLSSDVWVNQTDIREVGPDGKYYQYNVESFINYEVIK